MIATGTSICGASAVIATSTATGSDDEDIAYAIAMVTVFGTAAMALYPLAEAALGLTAHAYGLWAGASIHEVAQAVAAAFAGGDTSGEVGTIAKLSRVILLAPIVAGIGMAIARGHLLTKNEDGETATRGSVPCLGSWAVFWPWSWSPAPGCCPMPSPGLPRRRAASC